MAYIVKGKIIEKTGDLNLTEKSCEVLTLGQARIVAAALVKFGVSDVSASVEKTVSLEKKTKPEKPAEAPAAKAKK